MLLTALALIAPIGPPQTGLTQLAPETFGYIVDYVVPGEDELKWRSIPWRPTLLDGLRDGTEERKPVLLWAMNGHPLGTT